MHNWLESIILSCSLCTVVKPLLEHNYQKQSISAPQSHLSSFQGSHNILPLTIIGPQNNTRWFILNKHTIAICNLASHCAQQKHSVPLVFGYKMIMTLWVIHSNMLVLTVITFWVRQYCLENTYTFTHSHRFTFSKTVVFILHIFIQSVLFMKNLNELSLKMFNEYISSNVYQK